MRTNLQGKSVNRTAIIFTRERTISYSFSEGGCEFQQDALWCCLGSDSGAHTHPCHTHGYTRSPCLTAIMAVPRALGQMTTAHLLWWWTLWGFSFKLTLRRSPSAAGQGLTWGSISWLIFAFSPHLHLCWLWAPAAVKYAAGCKTERARFLVFVLQKLPPRRRRLKSVTKFPSQEVEGDDSFTETEWMMWCLLPDSLWWHLSEKNLTYKNKYSLQTTQQQTWTNGGWVSRELH